MLSSAWRGGGGMAAGRQLTLADVMDRAAQSVDALFLARPPGVLGQVLSPTFYCRNKKEKRKI
jgi:hypothetical protein